MLSPIDQGDRFGTWPDTTSRLIYHALTPAQLVGLPLDGVVVDLGGANGLLRSLVPQVVTVDINAEMNPDVVADVTTWQPDSPVDLAVSRYVTHYLSDDDLEGMFRVVAGYAPLLALTAITTDPEIKQVTSENEVKHWRTGEALVSLFDPVWQINDYRVFDVYVEPDFYRNRLNHPNPSGHRELITTWHLERR